MTKEFIDEVNQDIQEEKIYTFWQKYKYAVIGGIALIIGGTGANVGYDKYIESQKATQATAYESFVNGKTEALNELLSGQTGVRFITAVEQARKLSEAGDNKTASQLLLDFSKDADSPEKDYAVLASIWVGIGEVNSGELQSRLMEVTAPEYKALKLMTSVELFLQENKTFESGKVLEVIKADSDIPSEYKRIAKELMLVISQ